MKKIISAIALLSIMINIGWIEVFASSTITPEQKLQSLVWENTTKKIQKSVDTFINKQNSAQTLGGTLERFAKITKELEKKSTSSKAESIKKALYEDILVKWYNALYADEQDTFTSDMIAKGISEKEKSAVEDTILGLQKNFFKTINGNGQIPSIEKGRVTTGNVSGKLHLNIDSFWEIFWNLDISNFIEKALSPDRQTSFGMNVKANVNGVQKNISGEVQIINKSEEKYIKIDNMTQTGFTDETFTNDVFDQINSVFKQGKFIKFSNTSSNYYDELAANIQSSAPQWLNQLSTNALFKVYKKSGNSYILIPNKVICDIEKESSDSQAEACSDSEYEAFLQWYFYLNTLITLSLQDGVSTLRVSQADENLLSYAEISTDNTGNILALDADIIPNQDMYPGERASLQLKNGTLIGSFKAEWMVGSFTGKITNTEFSWSFQYTGDSSSEINGNFSFANPNTNSFKASVNCSGKNVFSDKDAFTINVWLQSDNQNTGNISISGSYKQNQTEVFSWNLDYSFKITENNALSIEAPTNWVDIEDITPNSGNTDITLP